MAAGCESAGQDMLSGRRGCVTLATSNGVKSVYLPWLVVLHVRVGKEFLLDHSHSSTATPIIGPASEDHIRRGERECYTYWCPSNDNTIVLVIPVQLTRQLGIVGDENCSVPNETPSSRGSQKGHQDQSPNRAPHGAPPMQNITLFYVYCQCLEKDVKNRLF